MALPIRRRHLATGAKDWIWPLASANHPSGRDSRISGYGHSLGYRILYALSRWDGHADPRTITTIAIPQDLEIREIAHLSSIRGVHRLFLRGGARLYPDHSRLLIDVHELISEGGIIETFAENSRAAEGENGRSGGTVRLFAQTARGDLTILARGEHGGQGRTGRTGKDSPDPGAEGETGESGGTGGNGGNSGRVCVKIATASPIQVRILRFPGDAGSAGMPGHGGVGANANLSVFEAIRRNASSPFVMGRTGKSGGMGRTGRSGSEDPFCLQIGETTYGDCEKLRWIEGPSEIW